MASYKNLKSGVNISVNFEELIDKIKKADGNINGAIMKAAKQGAQAYKTTLVNECNSSGVPANVIEAIKTECKSNSSGDKAKAVVGWRLDVYDKEKPSEGYKALFLNYGTPHRFTKEGGQRVQINGKWVTLGTDRGHVDGRGFITRAKKKAKSKIKRAQEDALKEILKGLEQ